MAAIARIDRHGLERGCGRPIAAGTNARIHAIATIETRVLRVAPLPDRFLLYAALLGTDLAGFAGGPAPRLFDVGFAADGTMICEVERLQKLPSRFADAGSLHQIAVAMGGGFHGVYRLIDRLGDLLLDMPGQFSGLDLEHAVVAENLLLRPGPGRAPIPVLTDPMGGVATEPDLAPVRRRHAHLARRWPGWAATVWAWRWRWPPRPWSSRSVPSRRRQKHGKIVSCMPGRYSFGTARPGRGVDDERNEMDGIDMTIGSAAGSAARSRTACRRRRRIALGVCLASLVAIGGARAQSASPWISNLASQESGGNFAQTNPASTAIGGYQMTEAALVASGYAKYAGPTTAADYNGADSNLVWTGKDGVTSTQSFLANQQAQTNAATAYSQQLWSTLNQQGTASQYIGQTVAGQKINQSAMLTGAYLLGPNGMQSYLQNGGQVYTTAAGVPCSAGSSGCSYNAALTAVAQKRISDGSQYDASSITGGYTQVAASQGTLPAGSSTPGNVGSLYCAPQVATLLQTGSEAFLNQQKQLVASPATGYTTLNGNSLLQAGGLAGGASQLGGLTGSYSQYSCLSNLLNGNLNVGLNLPNLSSILSGLLNEVCQAGANMVSQALQPIDQNLYQSTSIGGFFPGISVPLAGGVSTSFNQGGSTGVTINNGMGGSTSWFAGQNPTASRNYFPSILSSELP